MRKKRLRSLKKRKKIFQTKAFWFFLFLFCFSYFLFFFFYLSPVFQLKEIEIDSNDEMFAKRIMLEIKPGVNLLFLNPKEISSNLKEKYIELKEISIEKKLPSRIGIKIVKRMPVLIFCQKETNDCFLADDDGFLFKRAENEKLLKIELLGNLSLGQTVLNKEKILKISRIIAGLNQVSFFPAQAEWENDVFRVLILKKTSLFFDLEKEVDWQLEKFFTFINQEEIKKKMNDFEYIDLRFKDFVNYKYFEKTDEGL